MGQTKDPMQTLHHPHYSLVETGHVQTQQNPSACSSCRLAVVQFWRGFCTALVAWHCAQANIPACEQTYPKNCDIWSWALRVASACSSGTAKEFELS